MKWFLISFSSDWLFPTSLSEESISRTVNNILQDGVNLRSYRQAPNVGKRKSWAAGDAVSRGMEIALVSEFEDEIYSSVQQDGEWGQRGFHNFKVRKKFKYPYRF